MKKKVCLPPIPSAAIGVFAIAVIYLLISFVISAVRYGSSDSTANIPLFSALALVLSGAIGTFFSAKISGSETVMLSMIPASAATVVFTLITLIATGGKIELFHAVNMLCFLALSFLSAILAMPRKNKRRIRR